MKTFIFSILCTVAFLLLVAESESLRALLTTKVAAIVLILVAAKFYGHYKKDMHNLEKFMDE